MSRQIENTELKNKLKFDNIIEYAKKINNLDLSNKEKILIFQERMNNLAFHVSTILD